MADDSKQSASAGREQKEGLRPLSLPAVWAGSVLLRVVQMLGCKQSLGMWDRSP